jgi:hypothetical protein
MSHTKLGRYQAPEPLSALSRLHFHDGTTALKTVDHEPKVAVLDQEDLHKQGIVCSSFIPGAGNPDALGSCTANTAIEALSNLLTETEFAATVGKLGSTYPSADPYTQTAYAQRAAIGFYHGCTDQTGQSSSEWPPTDCGSSGPYLYQYAKKLGLIKTEKIAHGADNIVSLLQTGGLLYGTPWFNAWFTPNSSGFIDGNGSTSALQAAINSGVAGGHEIYVSAIEKLTVLPTGHVDPAKTVLRLRNHWDSSFGDHGSFRMHLSTMVALGGQVDLRQFA